MHALCRECTQHELRPRRASRAPQLRRQRCKFCHRLLGDCIQRRCARVLLKRVLDGASPMHRACCERRLKHNARVRAVVPGTETRAATAHAPAVYTSPPTQGAPLPGLDGSQSPQRAPAHTQPLSLSPCRQAQHRPQRPSLPPATQTRLRGPPRNSAHARNQRTRVGTGVVNARRSPCGQATATNLPPS